MIPIMADRIMTSAFIERVLLLFFFVKFKNDSDELPIALLSLLISF